MRIKILATTTIGLLAAACQAPYSQNGSSAYATYQGANNAAYRSSSQACIDYGFRAGTTSYNQCVSNEQAARSSGRVDRDYAPALLNADARNACSSYGLNAGTPGYDRCVSREMEARSYRDAAALPAAPYRIDQYGNRVDAQGYRVDANGYRVDAQGYSLDANGYRIATQTYPSPEMPAPGRPYSTPAVSGQAVSGDEFGNRYDAQGNRLDASGRVIPMRESRN